MLIFYSSFVSNEQVYFYFFQMNEFLVILKFKKHQHIGKSVVVFLKYLKEPKYTDFWLHFQFNKGLFCHFGTMEVNKKWHFFFVLTRILKIKKKLKSLFEEHSIGVVICKNMPFKCQEGVIFLFEINMVLKNRLVFDAWILKSIILTWNKREIKFKTQFTPHCPIWACIVAKWAFWLLNRRNWYFHHHHVVLKLK